MAIGWIDNIYNNSDSDYTLTSTDDRNNGVIIAPNNSSVDLGNSGARLHKQTHYRCDWCGIPWYYNGKHFKSISKGSKLGRKHIKIYQTEIEDTTWIVYIDGNTGRQIARQKTPKGDYHCTLRIEEKRIILDIVNDQSVTAAETTQVLNEVGKWVEKSVDIGLEIAKVVAE